MKEIPPPVIAAAVVIVVLLIAFFGWRMLNPPVSAPTHIGADGKKINAAVPPPPANPGVKGSPAGASAAEAQ